MSLVEMELSKIIIQENAEQQIIVLREKEGERAFPISIGITEAVAIDRRLKGIPTPRPMTHELISRLIAAMGGTLEKVVIGDLVDHTFIATLLIRQDEELLQVDCRPSDAIAVGIANQTPIFVNPWVLSQVC